MMHIMLKHQELPVYTIDADEEDQDKVLEFQTAIKRPIPIQVCKMPCAFEVETFEGLVQGAKGDYLMQGIEGEYYPCKASIFEATYDIVD